MIYISKIVYESEIDKCINAYFISWTRVSVYDTSSTYKLRLTALTEKLILNILIASLSKHDSGSIFLIEQNQNLIYASL